MKGRGPGWPPESRDDPFASSHAPTGLVLLSDSAQTEVPLHLARIGNAARVEFQLDGRHHSYALWRAADASERFPHVSAAKGCALVVCQDPARIVEREEEVFCAPSPLPHPLDVGVYHNPLLLALARGIPSGMDDGSRGADPGGGTDAAGLPCEAFVPLTKRLYREIVTGWRVRRAYRPAPLAPLSCDGLLLADGPTTADGGDAHGVRSVLADRERHAHSGNDGDGDEDDDEDEPDNADEPATEATTDGEEGSTAGGDDVTEDPEEDPDDAAMGAVALDDETERDDERSAGNEANENGDTEDVEACESDTGDGDGSDGGECEEDGGECSEDGGGSEEDGDYNDDDDDDTEEVEDEDGDGETGTGVRRKGAGGKLNSDDESERGFDDGSETYRHPMEDEEEYVPKRGAGVQAGARKARGRIATSRRSGKDGSRGRAAPGANPRAPARRRASARNGGRTG